MQEEDPRLAFIVDSNSNFRITISNALGRFKDSLPESSQLLMLDVKDREQVHSTGNEPFFWSKPKDFTASVWGRLSEGPLCLKCIVSVFMKSLTAIKWTHDTTCELVVITDGNTDDTESDMEAVADMLTKKGVPLRVVVFPYSRRSKVEAIRKLVSRVKGTIHLIPHDSRPQGLPVESQLKLSDALDSFLSMNQNLLISRQTFDSSGPGKIEFHFQTDESLFNSHTELVAQFFSQSPVDSPSYMLRGERRNYTTKTSEYKSTNSQFVVPLNPDQSRHWTLEYERHNNETVIGIAYARVSARDKHPISGQCILSDVSRSGDRWLPPTLNLILSRDLPHAVQNADVQVIIIDDKGKRLAGTYEEQMVLADDGLGAPDVTEGDGIYSRYLTEANQPGFYGVQVLVRNKLDSHVLSPSADIEATDCCGSSMPKPTRNSGAAARSAVSNLERIIDCGFLYVSMPFNPEDFAERISDLRVTYVDREARKVVLKYSEPIGANIQLETRLFRESEFGLIRTAFDSYGAKIETPAQGPFVKHKERILSVDVSDTSGGVYYAAIKVSTTTGSATVSNIVTFFMGPDATFLTTEGKRLPILVDSVAQTVGCSFVLGCSR